MQSVQEDYAKIPSRAMGCKEEDTQGSGYKEGIVCTLPCRYELA